MSLILPPVFGHSRLPMAGSCCRCTSGQVMFLTFMRNAKHTLTCRGGCGRLVKGRPGVESDLGETRGWGQGGGLAEVG